MAEVRTAFRPEFLNRLDETVLFHRLDRSQMGGIVDIQVERLAELLSDRDIELELDDGAREWLADAGYDPVYGARPLKRIIQRHLQDRLATMILDGSIHDGDMVEVGAGEDGLAIARQQPKAA
jgi:ATP-dependent Clp protease ATP-binding subunit ClpB